MDSLRLEMVAPFRISPWPIAIAVLSASRIFWAYLWGQIASPLSLATWIYAGALCADALAKTSIPTAALDLELAASSLQDLATRGAVAAGLCYIAFEIALGFSLSIREGAQTISIGGVLIGLAEASLIGATATLAWYALKEGQSFATHAVKTESDAVPAVVVAENIGEGAVSGTSPALAGAAGKPGPSNLKMSPDFQSPPDGSKTTAPAPGALTRSNLKLPGGSARSPGHAKDSIPKLDRPKKDGKLKIKMGR